MPFWEGRGSLAAADPVADPPYGAHEPAFGRVVAQLAATRPAGRDHFAWLRPNDRFGVFVPVLMGAGVVMSGLAWLVERLARMTAGPVLERRLAREITTLTIQLDESGLVPAPVDSRTAILLGPSRRMSERAA